MATAHTPWEATQKRFPKVAEAMEYITTTPTTASNASKKLIAVLDKFKSCTNEIKLHINGNMPADQMTTLPLKEWNNLEAVFNATDINVNSEKDFTTVLGFYRVCKETANADNNNSLPALAGLRTSDGVFSYVKAEQLKTAANCVEAAFARLTADLKKNGTEKKSEFAEAARLVQVQQADINTQPIYSITSSQKTQSGWYSTNAVNKMTRKHKMNTTANTTAANTSPNRYYFASTIPSMPYATLLTCKSNGPGGDNGAAAAAAAGAAPAISSAVPAPAVPAPSVDPRRNKPKGLNSQGVVDALVGQDYGTQVKNLEEAKQFILSDDIAKINEGFVFLMRAGGGLFDTTLGNVVANVTDKNTPLQESAAFSFRTRVFAGTDKANKVTRYNDIINNQCVLVNDALGVNDDAEKLLVQGKVKLFVERVSMLAVLKVSEQYNMIYDNHGVKTAAFLYMQQSYTNQRRQCMHSYLDNMMEQQITNDKKSTLFNNWKASRLSKKMKDAVKKSTLASAYASMKSAVDKEKKAKAAFVKVVEQRIKGYNQAVVALPNDKKDNSVFKGALRALKAVVNDDVFQNTFGALEQDVMTILTSVV